MAMTEACIGYLADAFGQLAATPGDGDFESVQSGIKIFLTAIASVKQEQAEETEDVENWPSSRVKTILASAKMIHARLKDHEQLFVVKESYSDETQELNQYG
jgi:hypothetical protein